jgi:hypothetical protein
MPGRVGACALREPAAGLARPARIASCAAHIAQVKGDSQTAVGHLRKATLVLIKAGRFADAERAFKEDLERFPKNSWSLEGLQQARQDRHTAAGATVPASSAAEAAPARR